MVTCHHCYLTDFKCIAIPFCSIFLITLFLGCSSTPSTEGRETAFTVIVEETTGDFYSINRFWRLDGRELSAGTKVGKDSKIYFKRTLSTSACSMIVKAAQNVPTASDENAIRVVFTDNIVLLSGAHSFSITVRSHDSASSIRAVRPIREFLPLTYAMNCHLPPEFSISWDGIGTYRIEKE